MPYIFILVPYKPLFHYAILSATIGTHILEQSWTSSEQDICV